MSRQEMMVDRFTSLPELCLEKILSLLSPQELLFMASLGNRALRMLADSDLFWQKFVPPNYDIIIGRSAQPHVFFLTYRQRFNHLVSLTLDMGDLIFFAGNRNSGKNSYLVGSQRLQIKNPNGWVWHAFGNESRFDNVRVLLGTGLISLDCRAVSRLLSDNTMYAAFLIFKIAVGGFGFRSVPITSGFAYIKEENDEENEDDSDADSEEDEAIVVDTKRFYLDVGEEREENVNLPRHRNDGWLEVELIRFFITYENELRDVMITVSGDDNLPMHGLILEGIEFRAII